MTKKTLDPRPAARFELPRAQAMLFAARAGIPGNGIRSTPNMVDAQLSYRYGHLSGVSGSEYRAALMGGSHYRRMAVGPRKCK